MFQGVLEEDGIYEGEELKGKGYELFILGRKEIGRSSSQIL